MWTVVCRNVNRAYSRLTTDSQHHIRLTAQRNVETAETDRISLLNWCNPWIMHLNLSRWWVLYLLHLLWMNSSALVSFFSAALGRKKKKTLIFWLWVFAGMTMWLLSGGGSSLPAWRSSLQRIHVVASLPLFSSSLRFPLLPLVLLNGALPQLLSFATSSSSSLSGVFHRLHRFLFMLHLLFVSSPLSTHSTPGFSTNPSTSTSFMCSSSTFSLSLLLFCFCWCVSLSARPCHSCMRERTPGARRVEWSNFPGEPDRCVRLLETFKEFQFPRADCSMNYPLATFGSLAPHSWYSLVYIFLYYSSINYILHWNFECDRQGEISPELAGKWARRERLLFFFTVPPLICR